MAATDHLCPSTISYAAVHSSVLDYLAARRTRTGAWLQDQEWVVQEAANGREALARLQGVAPDVILLDLMTPEMDGFASGSRKSPVFLGLVKYEQGQRIKL